MKSAARFQQWTVSSALADFSADRLSLRMPASLTDRLRVVVNGVDVKAFHRRTPAACDAQLHVMFVGRVIPEKGPDVLIDALARMQRTDIRLTLVGSKGLTVRAAERVRAEAASNGGPTGGSRPLCGQHCQAAPA